MADETILSPTTSKGKFRRWCVEFKYTLQRGYGWAQVPLLGTIAASTFKTAFPGLVDSVWKFLALTIAGFIGLYAIGYIDKKYRFLHEEGNYSVEVNPLFMKMIENTNSKDGKTST